jgi:Fe-coproporphyrin III synthase
MLMVSDLLQAATKASAGTHVPAPADRYGAPRRAPAVVVWNVCRHCNMTCPHCYAAATPAPSRQDLSTEEGKALLSTLKRHGVRQIIFSGGEPLLREDLVALVAHATGMGLNAHLSTNGVLIDEAMARSLSEAGLSYVGVSIDGLPAFNDAYRGLDDAFARALGGLEAARGAGLRTGLRMTVSRRNADALPALLDVACAREIDRFYVSHLVYSGRGRALMGEDLPVERSRALLEWLFGKAAELLEAGRPIRIVTGGNDADGPLLLLWLERRYGPEAARRAEALLMRRGGNSAGERILSVDHRGRVHPDQFWRSTVLADLRRDDFEVALAHPLRAALASRERRLTGRCGACRFVSLCRGSHRERALAYHDHLWASDPACMLEDAEIATYPTAQSATGGAS